MIRIIAFASAFVVACTAVAADSKPDLSEYRTVKTAIPSKLSETKAAAPGQPGYLGIQVGTNAQGMVVIAELAENSPAAKAGLLAGDVLIQLDGQTVGNEESLSDYLHAKEAGTKVRLNVIRKDKLIELTPTLAAVSRPIKPGSTRALLGLQVGESKDSNGVPITFVSTGSPAERAKLKVGELLQKIDGIAVTSQEKLRDILAEKKPNDSVTVTIYIADKALDMKLALGTESTSGGGGEGRGGRGGGGGPGGGGPGAGGAWDNRGAAGGGGGGRSNYWSKPTYKMAVIGIEYPDVKHSDKLPTKAWDEAFYSRNTYNKKSVTGQQVYGSLADYYHEQSFGKLKVEGKMFPYVEVSKKRQEYATGNRMALLTEAMDKLLARDGKDALKDYDGICFIYAGNRVQTTRGSLYWPHRSSVMHQGKRWPYFICPEGGDRMATISVYCHEFGHLLGLPDLYARPENPGSEGLAQWCAMSNQVGNGRPQHFSAWPKEKLGWIKPVTIDPTVPQKLILSPIEDSPDECFKVPLRADGSEYLLLENRRKKGFDQSLPAEGLLIWRVTQNRPLLEESHGVEGPAGPRVFQSQVPYPSSSNDSFTPYTTPSSQAQLGGGLPVFITNIRKLDDGRITFHIGYEYE